MVEQFAPIIEVTPKRRGRPPKTKTQGQAPPPPPPPTAVAAATPPPPEHRKTRQEILEEYAQSARRPGPVLNTKAEGEARVSRPSPSAPPPPPGDEMSLQELEEELNAPGVRFDPIAEARRLVDLDSTAQIVELNPAPLPAARLNERGDLAPPVRLGRGDPVPFKEITPPDNQDWIVISLPGGGRARVRREDIQVASEYSPADGDVNFRCMVPNTMIPSGHPDFYCDPEHRQVGFIVCPTCHGRCVIQLRDESGEWIAPFPPGKSVLSSA